jgi:2-methylcitrate dehydratase PrpD
VIAESFGKFIAEFKFDQLGQDIQDAIKLRILDTVGVGIAGAQLGLNLPAISLFEAANPSVQVWGTPYLGSAREAALANSYASHATYLEDGSRFTGGHPSSVLIPSIFAQAQSTRLSGRELIVAAVAGYEVFLRLGRDLYPADVNRGFQPTAVLAAVSSAAAMAKLLCLSAAQSSHCVAIGANLGVGMKEALKSAASQPLQVARGCEAGMIAARFAQSGLQGALEVFEKGFLPAFGGSVQTSTALNGLGQTFRIPETYLKRHAGCRGNHAPLDVALELFAAKELDIEKIKRIRVAVDTVTLAASIEEPKNGEQTQFSIGFSIAVALIHGNASLYQYNDRRLAEPAVQALMSRIEVVADSRLGVGYPEKRAATIEIEMLDGDCHQHAIDNARGEPGWPLHADEMMDKFFAYASPCLGENAKLVRDMIMNLEFQQDISQVAKLLTANVGSKK